MTGLTSPAAENGRSIWQVLGVYVVFSSAAWQVIDSLTDRVGLPEWVPMFAVVLFIIGLPIIIATALVQNRAKQRAIDHSYEPLDPTLLPESHSPSPAPAHSHVWLTWKRAIAGGIAAFLLLGITAGGYMGMRNAGIGPFGSLVAKGELDKRERVLIADFTGVGIDSIDTQAYTQAFRISLEQSTVISVVDAARVRSVLERMARDPKSHLDADLAREVAERDNIKAYIAGEVTKAGGAYVVAAKLVTTDGNLLAAVSSNAKEGEVLDAVQKVSKKLRTKIGESLRTLNGEKKLEDVTTPSIAALRKYAEGTSAQGRGDFEAARTAIEEAVRIDSTFAMAWRRLAAIYSNLGLGRELQARAATKAYENREHLTARERYHAIAYYMGAVKGDIQQTVDAYRNVLAIDPNDYAALNNLGLRLQSLRAFDEAIVNHQRETQLNPANRTGWVNLIDALIDANRMDSAGRVLKNWRKLGPSPVNYNLILTGYRTQLGDFEGAREANQTMIDSARSSPLYKSIGTIHELSIDRIEGKLHSASQKTERVLQMESDRQNAFFMIQGYIYEAVADITIRRDPARGLSTLRNALPKAQAVNIDPADRLYLEFAQAFALAGDAATARSLLQRYASEVRAVVIEDERDKLMATGNIALAEKNYAQAIDDLRRASEMGDCTGCGGPNLALAFEAAGQPDSAIAYYEKAVSTVSGQRIFVDGFIRAPSHERLAELYEQKGNRAKAIEHATKFIELWKNADAELQPRVQAKRALLQRVTQER